MYDNEKVLKASDQRDIVWFVSSASKCYLRTHRPECFGRVKRTFCLVSPSSKLKMFTGSVCVRLTAVSFKLIKIKTKLIYATTSSCEKKKKQNGG